MVSCDLTVPPVGRLSRYLLWTGYPSIQQCDLLLISCAVWSTMFEQGQRAIIDQDGLKRSWSWLDSLRIRSQRAV